VIERIHSMALELISVRFIDDDDPNPTTTCGLPGETMDEKPEVARTVLQIPERGHVGDFAGKLADQLPAAARSVPST
jgi:hypothetical protein